MFVVLAVVMRLAGFSIFKLVRYLREELSIVLGTTSSDAVLPQIMRKLEWMGVKDSTVGLVIPIGYSFNLDGFSIYLTLAVIFISQATNTPLSLHDLIVVLVSLVTSKGAHGIFGFAIVILAATLSAIPVLGLLLILPVDWFVGIARDDQPDRQLRGDGGRRGVGERYRLGARQMRARHGCGLPLRLVCRNPARHAQCLRCGQFSFVQAPYSASACSWSLKPRSFAIICWRRSISASKNSSTRPQSMHTR